MITLKDNNIMLEPFQITYNYQGQMTLITSNLSRIEGKNQQRCTSQVITKKWQILIQYWRKCEYTYYFLIKYQISFPFLGEWRKRKKIPEAEKPLLPPKSFTNIVHCSRECTPFFQENGSGHCSELSTCFVAIK